MCIFEESYQLKFFLLSHDGNKNKFIRTKTKTSLTRPRAIKSVLRSRLNLQHYDTSAALKHVSLKAHSKCKHKSEILLYTFPFHSKTQNTRFEYFQFSC